MCKFEQSCIKISDVKYKLIISGPLENKISRNESKLFGLLVSQDSVKERKLPSQSLCRVVMLTNTNTTRISKQDGDN